MYSRCTGNVGAPGKSHRANHWNGAIATDGRKGTKPFVLYIAQRAHSLAKTRSAAVQIQQHENVND